MICELSTKSLCVLVNPNITIFQILHNYTNSRKTSILLSITPHQHYHQQNRNYVHPVLLYERLLQKWILVRLARLTSTLSAFHGHVLGGQSGRGSLSDFLLFQHQTFFSGLQQSHRVDRAVHQAEKHLLAERILHLPSELVLSFLTRSCYEIQKLTSL